MPKKTRAATVNSRSGLGKPNDLKRIEVPKIHNEPDWTESHRCGRWNLRGYVIHDRDPLFTIVFLNMLGDSGSEVGETTAAVAQLERVR